MVNDAVRYQRGTQQLKDHPLGQCKKQMHHIQGRGIVLLPLDNNRQQSCARLPECKKAPRGRHPAALMLYRRRALVPGKSLLPLKPPVPPPPPAAKRAQGWHPWHLSPTDRGPGFSTQPHSFGCEVSFKQKCVSISSSQEVETHMLYVHTMPELYPLG